MLSVLTGRKVFLHLGCLKEMLMVTYSHTCNMLEWVLGMISMYHVCSRGKGERGANVMVSFLLFVQHFVFAFFFSFSEAGF